MRIFANNDIATLCIILGDLTSAGFLAAAGLVWNGFLLGSIYQETIVLGISSELLAFSSSHLAGYTSPDDIGFWQDIPKILFFFINPISFAIGPRKNKRIGCLFAHFCPF